jgi:hypothetical protein
MIHDDLPISALLPYLTKSGLLVIHIKRRSKIPISFLLELKKNIDLNIKSVRLQVRTLIANKNTV